MQCKTRRVNCIYFDVFSFLFLQKMHDSIAFSLFLKDLYTFVHVYGTHLCGSFLSIWCSMRKDDVFLLPKSVIWVDNRGSPQFGLHIIHGRLGVHELPHNGSSPYINDILLGCPKGKLALMD